MTAALRLADFSDPATEPEALVVHLRQGEHHLFEAGLARRLSLRLVEVRRMVHERAGARLAVACRAAGFSREQFEGAYRLIQSSIERLPAPGVCGADWPQQLGELFDLVRPADAELTLKRWRRALTPAFPSPY